MQQRQCLILQGDRDWCTEQAHVALTSFATDDVLWLSTTGDKPAHAVPVKQAQQHLGREFAAIVFDAVDAFAADSFAAVIGTLKAGGVIIILLPASLPDSPWLRRFLAIAAADCYSRIQIIRQGNPVPLCAPVNIAEPKADIEPTPEQQQAIAAVLKVVSGHRRRPLLITSDRGRGKSALLGMAAAELLRQGKQLIIVTAPGLASVDTLMRHAARLLPDSKIHRSHIDWNHAEIRFIAPDALLAAEIKADLLLVDEAAAIPLQMLQTLLSRFSRIVFSTTEHGYEGTGRGFALRFRHYLDQQTPGWLAVRLIKPVRWAEGDELEAFSFDALLLDAEPAANDLVKEATAGQCEFALLYRRSLAEDESCLRQLFGLMVLAHYRTRPSDLQMLLDRDDISVAVLRYQGQVVASAWLVSENALEPELAQAVFNGERRLKGQLLPQSLLVHAGLLKAGELNYQRVIRIAVHPILQQRGLGSFLLAELVRHIPAQTDIVGTSFAMHDQLPGFWLKNGFVPVRVGHHQDQVSGSHALLMLKAISTRGQALQQQAVARFSHSWPLLLSRSLKNLPVEQVLAISKALPVVAEDTLQADGEAELEAFAHASRPFESCEAVLWQWLQGWLASAAFAAADDLQKMLLILVIMQQYDFSEAAAKTGLKGKAEVIQQLRQAVSAMLEAESAETR